MSLPFLTEEDILPTYLDLELSLSGLTDNELQLVSTFKKYISKNWVNGSENLSVFTTNFAQITVLNRTTNLLTDILKQTTLTSGNLYPH